MAGADHVVHFFADGPIPTESILAARPRQLTIAGPVAPCVDIAALARSSTRVVGWSRLTVNAVAEFTIALMLVAMRRPIGSSSHDGPPPFGRELQGATLGIVGFGQIGQAVAVKAKSLGMRVLVASPSMTADTAAKEQVEICSLADLAVRSDVISVHARVRAGSKPVLSKEFIASMRPDAILVNTARPSLVDLVAVREALRAGHLAHLALEVPAGTLPDDDELWASPRATLTPHIAWMTEQALEALLGRAWKAISDDPVWS